MKIKYAGRGGNGEPENEQLCAENTLNILKIHCLVDVRSDVHQIYGKLEVMVVCNRLEDATVRPKDAWLTVGGYNDSMTKNATTKLCSATQCA
jgi:hypothetical protein